jgi:deoxycytidine triphosphate deaminase
VVDDPPVLAASHGKRVLAMLMTDGEIKQAMAAGDLEIQNFDAGQLQAASYDAGLGDRALLGGKDAEIDVAGKGALTIHPGEFVLMVTKERFKLSNTLAGTIGLRSYFGRKGLLLLAGLQIDPGFEGHLIIGGYNAAPRRLTLDYEAPFLTIEFNRLSRPAEKAYAASGEQLKGELPRVDKDYLRTLEALSLSEIANELRTLAQNVGAMQKQLKFFYAPLLVGTFLAVVAFGLASLLK